jgi:SAM-dependent methyltransferase
MNIKATFKNDVELTLSDTSEDCILANREAFANHGLAARFLTGDLFDSEFNEEFDIVINTGLLEHFEPTDAERLLRRISQSLRPDGTYMTLVPYADGRLYRLCMARMKKKGTWELGPEKPLSTFKNLRSDQLVLVEERPIDALFQLSFVPSAFPGMGSIALPAIVLMKNAPRVFEPIFMRVMSGYALYGKFVKISRAPKE